MSFPSKLGVLPGVSIGTGCFLEKRTHCQFCQYTLVAVVATLAGCGRVGNNRTLADYEFMDKEKGCGPLS